MLPSTTAFRKVSRLALLVWGFDAIRCKGARSQWGSRSIGPCRWGPGVGSGVMHYIYAVGPPRKLALYLYHVNTSCFSRSLPRRLIWTPTINPHPYCNSTVDDTAYRLLRLTSCLLEPGMIIKPGSPFPSTSQPSIVSVLPYSILYTPSVKMLHYLQQLDDFIAMLVLELDNAATHDLASPLDEKLDACKISLV